MIKKVVLLLGLLLNFVFIQNNVFAQVQNPKNVYLDNLHTKIVSNWLVPAYSKDKSTVISFTVNNEGTISNVQMERSSGDDDFDQSAVAAIYKSDSFGPFVYSGNMLNLQFFFSPVFTDVIEVGAISQLFDPSNPRVINIADKYINFDDYAENLQNKITPNWNPKSLKSHRSALISVKVDKDGTLDSMEVLKSSNKKKFDYEVLDSVMRSVPLDPLPDNLQADYKNILLNFSYQRTRDENVPKKRIIANINGQEGYDKYIENVDKVIAAKIKDKKYFCKKDVMLEMNIEKDGKLKYVKIKNPTKHLDFNKRDFNRKLLVSMQKTSFPPIPDEMGTNNITLDCRILTQRKRKFINLISDYIGNLFRTGLESFSVQTPENI